MRKGYTILGVLLVLIIVSILAIGALPEFRRIMRRAEMGEVRGMVDSIRAGARQYVFKQGTIATLALSSDPPPADVWDQLNIDVDPNAVCAYTIVDLSIPARRWLQVDSSGDWLYRYELPDDSDGGDKNSSNADYRYIQDLP